MLSTSQLHIKSYDIEPAIPPAKLLNTLLIRLESVFEQCNLLMKAKKTNNKIMASHKALPANKIGGIAKNFIDRDSKKANSEINEKRGKIVDNITTCIELINQIINSPRNAAENVIIEKISKIKINFDLLQRVIESSSIYTNFTVALESLYKHINNNQFNPLGPKLLGAISDTRHQALLLSGLNPGSNNATTGMTDETDRTDVSVNVDPPKAGTLLQNCQPMGGPDRACRQRNAYQKRLIELGIL